VLLAVAGIIIFFVVEELGALMVVFDSLSPLFSALFVLTVLAAVLALIGSDEEVKSKRSRKT
jgi:hypothetical protein